MKLQTPVEILPGKVKISLSEKTLVIGSCFADNIGRRLLQGGFDVLVNPFGTLYNPLSILSSIERLGSGKLFTGSDVVEMGSGAGMFSSFSHHSSFARNTAEEFLSNANARLDTDACFWKECSKVIITLGTAFCFYKDGVVVSNCLKRPAAEFERRMMTVEEITDTIARIGTLCKGKETIWTVSPVRHLSDGAHGNALSKASLLLGIDKGARCCDEYFPSFEIMMDELRDYRFYDEDMAHPSSQAADYIYERFLDFAALKSEREKIGENFREWKRSKHVPMLKK